MSDLKDFENLLNRVGLKYSQSGDENEDTLHIESNSSGDKTIGYVGFYVDIKFDKLGNFINIGIWE